MNLYYSNEIRQLVDALGRSSSFNEAVKLWSESESKIPDLDIIISLNGCQNQTPQKLINFNKDTEGNLLSYFEKENFCYINKEIISKSTKTRGVDLPLDYSISFDTNFANYINTVIRGKKLSKKDELLILKIIDSLLRNEINYDHSFYMIENIKQIINLITNTTPMSSEVFWKKLNKSFRQNLVSLVYFQSIDKKHYIKTLAPKFKISYRQAVKRAIKHTHSSYNSKSGRVVSFYHSSMQKKILLILIKIISIQLCSNTNATKKIDLLLNYMQSELGTYFDRETVIAFEYYLDRKKVPIFRKVNKGINPKNLLNTLNNIAWDMLAMRTMEEIMQIEQNSKFYIPYFLTFDANLKKLHHLYQVKGAVFSKKLGFFTTISNRNLYAFCENNPKLIDVIDKYFCTQAVNERKNKEKPSNAMIATMIDKEYIELQKVINKS